MWESFLQGTLALRLSITDSLASSDWPWSSQLPWSSGVLSGTRSNVFPSASWCLIMCSIPKNPLCTYLLTPFVSDASCLPHCLVTLPCTSMFLNLSSFWAVCLKLLYKWCHLLYPALLYSLISLPDGGLCTQSSLIWVLSRTRWVLEISVWTTLNHSRTLKWKSICKGT